MYNRYIPQPDGSYRRNRMPDQSRPVQPKPAPPMQVPTPPPEPQKDCQPPKQEHCPMPRQEHCPMPRQDSCPRSKQDKQPAGGSIGGFLRQLLPKDFDTGDLLIILLLLLMAGDCAEDQNTAILTLALYLFM